MRAPFAMTLASALYDPVRRIAVVLVDPGLVVAVEHVLLGVLWPLLDPLPVDVHDHDLLVGMDAADPRGGQRHLLARQPSPGIDNQVAKLEIVVDREVHGLADFPVRGLDAVPEA